jgi:hypothetical protein
LYSKSDRLLEERLIAYKRILGVKPPKKKGISGKSAMRCKPSIPSKLISLSPVIAGGYT